MLGEGAQVDNGHGGIMLFTYAKVTNAAHEAARAASGHSLAHNLHRARPHRCQQRPAMTALGQVKSQRRCCGQDLIKRQRFTKENPVQEAVTFIIAQRYKK